MAKRKKKDRRKRRRPLRSMMPIPGAVQAQIEELLQDEQPDEALAVIEEWFEKRTDHPLLCFYAGCAHGELGNLFRSVTYLRKAQRGDRRNESILHNLVLAYMELDFSTHALRVLRRYLRTALALTGDDTDQLQSLRTTLDRYQDEAAVHFGVRPEYYEEADYWNEEAQIAQWEGDWDAAIAAADKALKVLPDHAPALNNRALTFCFVGRLEEAITDEERVLAVDPNNVHALANLTRFHYLRADREAMRTCFERLQALSPDDWAYQSIPIPKMLEAYAAAGTDEQIHAFLEQYAEEASARGYYMLGAAAANLGRPREAVRVWRKMAEDGTRWRKMAQDGLEALRAGRFGLGRGVRFPYTTAYELVAEDQLARLMEIMQETEDDSPERHRAMEGIDAQHPGLLEAARWFLWYDDQASPALEMLATLGTERAWEEVRTFALGQAGTNEERLKAAHLLAERGHLPTDEPVRLWMDGEWRELLLRKFEITDEPYLPYSEEVLELLVQAGEVYQGEDWDEAERIYRHILELEPNCCPAYQNLAVIASMRGDVDTMRAYVEKSLEIDPDYVMGRCSLAGIHLQEGRIDLAEELVKPLMERTQFAPFEMRAYQLLQARIHILRDNLEAAASILAVLQDLYPDDPAVNGLDERLSLLQSMANMDERMREQARRMRERNYARPLDEGASLETCLGRHIKETLYEFSRRLGISGVSGYRKAELVDVVAEWLREVDALREILSELPDRAREAMGYVLGQGGVVSWDAFNERYDNDLDDVYYIPYTEPDTVMGQLRMTGLLYIGTEAGERRVRVPAELRTCLRELGREVL